MWDRAAETARRKSLNVAGDGYPLLSVRKCSALPLFSVKPALCPQLVQSVRKLGLRIPVDRVAWYV